MSELLYLNNSYLKEAEGKVLEINENKFVVLDKSIFYPQGGGQPSDTGFLEFQGKKSRVVFAKKINGKISLEVEGINFQKGDVVKQMIDWNKRYKLMRMHTAAHLLSAILFKEYNAKITGNQLKEDESRMDFNLSEWNDEIIKELEEKANNEASKAHEVSVEFIERKKAEEKPEIARLSKGLPEGIKVLRLVRIGSIDLQADAGTHVKNTKEIGRIIITRKENKGKNNKRIYFKLE